jgi:hypothetical protein
MPADASGRSRTARNLLIPEHAGTSATKNHLAKVDVAGSNQVARSNSRKPTRGAAKSGPFFFKVELLVLHQDARGGCLLGG